MDMAYKLLQEYNFIFCINSIISIKDATLLIPIECCLHDICKNRPVYVLYHKTSAPHFLYDLVVWASFRLCGIDFFL